MRPAETFHRYQALDFAPLIVLHHVKHAVVDAVAAGWQQQLGAVSPSPGGKSPGERPYRTAMNLAAGFLSALESAKNVDDSWPRDDVLRIYRGDVRTNDFDILSQLISSHGHRLFNSYFYLITEVFGERSLVPVLPGVHSGTARRGVDAGIFRLVRSLRLPFHVDEQYVDTYESQLLPMRAGLTPFSCQIFEEGLLEKVTNVSMFLGDLAVLHKREDYVHKHLSALIAMLSSPVQVGGSADDGQKCMGALVLSSVMPSAFRDTFRAQLQKAIEELWTDELGERLRGDLRSSERAIYTSLHWLPERPEQEPLPAFHSDVERVVAELLARRVPQGAIATRATISDSSELICSVAAVNIEGVARLLRGIFPSGPWLSEPLVTRGAGIELERIRKLSGLLRCEFDDPQSAASPPSDAAQPDYLQTLMRLVAGLYADVDIDDDTLTQLRSHLVVRPLGRSSGQSRGQLLVLAGTPTDSHILLPQHRLLQELQSLLSLIVLGPRLPGASNRGFSSLQQLWNQQRVFQDSKPEPAESKSFAEQAQTLRGRMRSVWRRLEPSRGQFKEEDLREVVQLLFEAIELLLQGDLTIRALLVLLDCECFVPEFAPPVAERDAPGVATARQAFREAYLAYPCYWLFETLNHVIAADALRIEDFDELPLAFRYWTRLSAEQTAGLTPRIRVRLSSEEGSNERWLKALTYFGIPVYEWTGCGIRGPQDKDEQVADDHIDLEVDLAADSVPKVYREYLNRILSHGARVPSLSRVFRRSAGSFEVRGVSLELQPGRRVAHRVRLLSAGGEEFYEHILWAPLATRDLAFCGLNSQAVVRDVAAVPASRPPRAAAEGQRMQVRVESLQLPQGWTSLLTPPAAADGSSPLVIVGRVSDELQALVERHRRDEEAARQQILNVVTHEIATALSPVRELIAVATTGSRVLSLEQAAEYANNAVHFIMLNIAAFGDPQKNDSVDLLGKEDWNLADGWKRLVDIATVLGVTLAHKRSDYGELDEEKWVRFMQARVLDDSRLERPDLQFWRHLRGPELGRRLGAETTLATCVANTVQHIVLYLAKALRDAGRTEEELEPPDNRLGQAQPDELLRLTLTPEHLTIWNLGLNDDSFDGLSGAASGRGGILTTLKNCIQRREFGWENPGRITQFERMPTSLNGVAEYTLAVRLPQPFWRE